MRAVQIAAAALVAATAVAGCTTPADTPAPGTTPSSGAASVSPPTGPVAANPVPKPAALGDGWATDDTAFPVIPELCGVDLLPPGDRVDAFLTDPDGRLVVVEFVTVADAYAAADTTAQTIADCEASKDARAMYYAWTTPSSVNDAGALGYVMPVQESTGDQLPGGVGIAAVPVSGTVLATVVVYAAPGDDGAAETVELYADHIARNQIDANRSGGGKVAPVPALKSIKSPIVSDPVEPVVPPVGTVVINPDEDPEA